MLSLAYNIRHELNDCPLKSVNVALFREDESYIVTHPDIYFSQSFYCFYIDGPPHTHNTVIRHDDEVNRLLPLNKYFYKRYPYTRSTKAWEREVYEDIKSVINEKTKVNRWL